MGKQIGPAATGNSAYSPTGQRRRLAADGGRRRHPAPPLGPAPSPGSQGLPARRALVPAPAYGATRRYLGPAAALLCRGTGLRLRLRPRPRSRGDRSGRRGRGGVQEAPAGGGREGRGGRGRRVGGQGARRARVGAHLPRPEDRHLRGGGTLATSFCYGFDQLELGATAMRAVGTFYFC